MATILTRKRRDGGVSYTARIRLKHGPIIVHEETKTFDGNVFKKKDVERWAGAREQELHAPDALLGVKATMTLEQAIARYTKEYPDWGRSKLSALAQLKKAKVAQMRLVDLRPQHLIDHVKERRASGTGPATTQNDLTWIRVVFKTARIAWQIPVKEETVDGALEHCREQRIVSRGNQRERRPTLAELTQLMDWFGRGDGRLTIPMSELMLFALFSARRQEEITLLRREDYDAKRKVILVRDAKHPRDPKFSLRVSVPEEAAIVLERQPKGELFFPYNPKSIGADFTRACKMLGIEDLHFHDLRHEAASRLFELGWTIPQVAQVTGHRSWQNLQRYTHLSGPEPIDKYAKWSFRPRRAR